MSGFMPGMRRSGNGLLVRISVIAAIGGLLIGYDAGVGTGPAARDGKPAGWHEPARRTKEAA